MRPFFLLTVSAAALSLGAGLLARQRSRRAAPGRLDAVQAEGFEPTAREVTRNVLKYFVMPVWLAAGVSDWRLHRATRIEQTTGLKESLMHLLMMAEAGAPIAAGMLLEIDPLILSAIIASFFLHEATAMWDVSYAVTAREVSPLEQHVHSFLEMTPLLAVTLITAMHWPQLKALAGLRVEPPRRLRWKEAPLSRAYLGGAFAGMTALEILPYVEEAVRCWRAHPGRLAPPAAGG